MRVVLGLEYDGSRFCGWQTQPEGCAIQDHLERALAAIAGHKIATVCAGRTDAGVHAMEQVVHFDTAAQRPQMAWVRGVNALLPHSIAVTWARPVGEDFHARYGARSRSYRYVLLNHAVRPAADWGRAGWYHGGLDVGRMNAAAQMLVGEHDFSAFRSSECQARSPVRTIHHIDVRRTADFVFFDLRANAFLHHMVRNIVGSLIHVGSGRQAPGWMRDVLAARDRARAAPTFGAAGLYLVQVEYDGSWNLPQGRTRLFFLHPPDGISAP
jgi:tRNA pseudouridine38-40 synthase